MSTAEEKAKQAADAEEDVKDSAVGTAEEEVKDKVKKVAPSG